MPAYDFLCPKCGAKRTQVVGINDIDKFVATCKCDTRMIRVYGVGGVAFKGSGFYRTDKDK